MKFTDPTSARTINRLRVLNLLRQEKAMSRADISRALSLNKPSTSEIVATLIEEGFAAEGEKIATASGRRPTAISLVCDATLVLGVELGSLSTSFILSDLQGTVLRFERLPTPQNPDPKAWGQQVIRNCMKLTATVPRVAGIVVATAAKITDDRKTIVRHENWPAWENIPLAEGIEKHAKLPAILVHNTEAMVIAEQYFGLEESEAFFYVNWAQHINAAWVHQNSISSDRSKFGHLPVASTGLCRCGGIGCLETLSSGWALKEKSGGFSVKQLNQNGSLSPLLEEACTAMATALIWAASITGAEKIIIGGGISNLNDTYLAGIQASFAQRAHHEVAETPIVRSALAEHSSTLGAVAVALDRWVFQHSLLKVLQEHEKPLPDIG
ncbi:MAG TPA: ROK family transcriptional regulator [Sphaerochaeta sp.]|nr:ROK family transcriptional regulator [Sphaerochaeta sp.]